MKQEKFKPEAIERVNDVLCTELRIDIQDTYNIFKIRLERQIEDLVLHFKCYISLPNALQCTKFYKISVIHSLQLRIMSKILPIDQLNCESMLFAAIVPGINSRLILSISFKDCYCLRSRIKCFRYDAWVPTDLTFFHKIRSSQVITKNLYTVTASLAILFVFLEIGVDVSRFTCTSNIFHDEIYICSIRSQ